MTSLVKILNRNPVFKFISSVRLAVPLMITIALVVAAGTIYESQYNAQVARIKIYQTFWFEGILILLWCNIFCSMISRIPYKKHHIGFVITHIGLLTLLIGAQLTAFFGIDGQLRVPEGQRSNIVFLPDLVLRVMSTSTPNSAIALDKRYPLKRSLDIKTGDQLGLPQVQPETGILVENYLPFVTGGQGMTSEGNSNEGSGTSLAFSLQSQFFNVNETLNTSNKSEMQMGPAILKVVTDSASQESSENKALAHSAPATPPTTSPPLQSNLSASLVLVKDEKSHKVLDKITLKKLKSGPYKVNGVQINLLQVYEQAAVAGGKLVDSGQVGANPALDLQLESAGQMKREVVFSKFPTFSLNPKGSFGLRFEYIPSLSAGKSHTEQVAQAAPADSAPGIPPMGAGSNIIEFHLTPSNTQSLRIVLLKRGAQVLSRSLQIGEVLQTPWMGMKITVTSIAASKGGGSPREEIRAIEMQPRKPLPPSALFLRSDLPGVEGTWLVEGTVKSFKTSRGTFDVYYGQDSVELPFHIKLDQFLKVDYPGTATPMSFESMIRLNDGGTPTKIQMNEPFEHEGYFLYQSSYEQGPGIPTASIFSVNRDPGRTLKYFGAIILVLGIAIFTVMRSKWFMKLKFGSATASILAFLLCTGTLGLVIPPPQAHADTETTYKDFSPEAAKGNLTHFASGLDTSLVEAIPVQSHGRVKPFESFTREAILFITGKFSFWGLNSTQLYLGLIGTNAAPYVEIINIRDPDLRVSLGFQKSQRYFSFQQLKSTNLEQRAQPILAKQERDEKSLNPEEKAVLEVLQQSWLFREVFTGAQFYQALALDTNSTSNPATQMVLEKGHQYLGALRDHDFSRAAMVAMELNSASKVQPMPDLFRPGMGKLKAEVLYNHSRPFFWVSVFYMVIGVLLVSGLLKKHLNRKRVFAVLALPFALHVGGFAARVYITGFAPVTNMYGTMIWMAFGVVLFSAVLFALYQNAFVFGLLLIGSSSVLMLTESIPLILSPDMDPIVAVLRNNFWLSIHVLTISISYAAFTIAMLIGNTALIQSILRKSSAQNLKELAHLAYRAIQMGVFLLTAGIILGGWWADYSWGRFWGWDPKETWALIADLGFLAILHARYAGWLGPYGLLAAAPIAYLLVIMAWYGVNFILAAGLHSYGFSSGGTTIVVSFVLAQLLLSASAMGLRGPLKSTKMKT